MLKIIKSFLSTAPEQLEEFTITPQKVLERAIALSSVITRADIIETMKNSSDGVAYKYNEKVLDQHDKYVRSKGYDHFMTPQEIEWSYKNFEMFNNIDFINIAWRSEALGTILWSLKLIEQMPEYDTEFDKKTVLSQINEANKSMNPFKKISLRKSNELLHARDIAELWDWRVNMALNGKDLQPQIIDLCRIASREAFLSGDIANPIKNDLPYKRKSFHDLNESEIINAKSIAIERLTALNWLCMVDHEWND